MLPDDLQGILEKNYAEIPNFRGYRISDEKEEIELIEQLIKYANQYKKDMEYQIMALNRRINTRVPEKTSEILNR